MGKVISYRSGMSNGYFVRGEDGVIAVDTGAEHGEEYVRQYLREAGIKPQEIKLMVITHGHVDHFMNVQAWHDVVNMPVLCHVAAARFLEEGLLPDEDLEGRTKMGREMWEAQKKMGNPILAASRFHPDIVIGEDTDLKGWGVDGTLVCTPGHTRGCISVVVGEEAIGGDLFAAPAHTDAVGMNYFQFLGAPYELSQNSVQKLLDRGVRIFWPGHGTSRDADYVRQKLEEEKAGKEMYYTLEELRQMEQQEA